MTERRIFTPSLGPSCWRAFLADPFLHWKRGKSAWELAVSWEAAANADRGLPPQVEKVLDASPGFTGARLLLAIPEHRVVLDDVRRPSQCDLWAVLWTPGGHASVAVEAKAGEEFDRPIDDWLRQDSKGKEKRLVFLKQALGLGSAPMGAIRYQLVHRTAAALLEAKRCHFPIALMLVQSFEESKSSWSDYGAFTQLLELPAARGAIVGPTTIAGIDLYLGWVDAPKAGDNVAARAI